MHTQLNVSHESWPIAGSFTISRGAKTAAEVVIAEIRAIDAAGRGECVPYARYGETVDGVMSMIRKHANAVADGLTRRELQTLMPPGAARNAIDCALWDLEGKRSGVPAWRTAGLAQFGPLTTAYTLSLDTPDVMAQAARNARDRPLLKIKLGQEGDRERLRAVRAAAPNARLIIDANEGWSGTNINAMFAACQDAGVELIEQPLPADEDGLLADIDRPVPVCADESVHGLASLAGLTDRYDAINIKLDKTGGLTEALALSDAAHNQGMTVMVGCMLATSLAMAPAMIVAQNAAVVDLDGPLLLALDRTPGISFEGSLMHPPPSELWG